MMEFADEAPTCKLSLDVPHALRSACSHLMIPNAGSTARLRITYRTRPIFVLSRWAILTTESSVSGACVSAAKRTSTGIGGLVPHRQHGLDFVSQAEACTLAWLKYPVSASRVEIHPSACGRASTLFSTGAISRLPLGGCVTCAVIASIVAPEFDTKSRKSLIYRDPRSSDWHYKAESRRSLEGSSSFSASKISRWMGPISLMPAATRLPANVT